MESESSQNVSVAAETFVWPERAITDVEPFHPTAQPIVSITQFHMKEDSTNKSYAVYEIQIELPGNRWTVQRRFREFDSLSTWLRANVPHVQIPPLPSKINIPWINAEQTAQNRLPVLDAFLQAVRGSSELFDLWQVRNFFGMDTHSDDVEAPPLSTSAGILYVNIMECRNLPLRDPAANKPPSAYCEIQLANSIIMDVLPAGGAAASSKEQPKLTESFPDSRGPRFFEEFVFSTANRRVPLQIAVRDATGLLQKPLLGYVQLDLRCFKEHHLYEFWLPLLGPSAASKGEIHISLQFNPMNITRPIASRLPSLRVHLHKFSFYPGEVVRGVVVFNVGKTMPAQRVFLQIYGVQETKWNFKLPNAPATPIKQTVPLLNDCRALWHHSLNQSNREEIYPGTYCWPFEFVLPPRMLPSACSTNGWNLYGLAMQIDRTIGTLTLDRKKHAHVPLIVRAPFTSVDPLPSTYGVLQRQSHRIPRDDQVVLDGRMDSPVLVVGDTHKLHLSVENKCKSSEGIAIRVKLIGFFVYKAVDRSSSATNEAIDIIVKDNMPIQAGETKSFDLNLNLPLDVFPSLPTDLSPLITVHWYVRISCTMRNESGTTAITSDIPVILSMPLPPPVDAIVHPPMYPSVQPEVRSMIEYGAGVPHFPKNMISSFASLDSLLKTTGDAVQLQASATATSAPPTVAPTSIYDSPLSLPSLDSIATNANKRYTISPDAMTGQLDSTDLRAPPPTTSFFFGSECPPNYPRGIDPARMPPAVYAMFSDEKGPAPRAPDDPSMVASSGSPNNAIHVSTTTQ